MNFKKGVLAFAALICAQFGFSAEWIDVTASYITNPNFDNDDVTTGWEGTSFGSVGGKENAEHYSKAFDTYQVLRNLTPGTYRLSLKAFYRSGSAQNDYSHYNGGNASDYQHAQLYATSSEGDFSTALPLLCSAAMTEDIAGTGSITVSSNPGGWGGWGGGTYYWVPNNMESAHYWFNAGHYETIVQDITVGTDGELRIGVRKANTISEDWVCLDDWKLEYYGDITYVTSVKMPSTTLTMAVGETKTLTPTVNPSNATIKQLAWASSNESVATVDNNGTIEALSAGTTKITATSTDGSNRKGTTTLTVVFTGAKEGDLIVNELMPANIDMFVDPSWNYGGFMELYNPGNESVSIAGYWVSDDPENLQKAIIHKNVGNVPAKGYRTLWFDHADTRKDINEKWSNTQVDMKLSCEGGTVYISDLDGNIILQQDYPAAIMRCSYARTEDGGSDWNYSATPSPDATNSGMTFASTQLPEPEVDQPGQLINGSKTVKVKIPSGATLRYTLDGSTPTMESEANNTGTFKVYGTTVLRLRLFQDGYLPSNVVTRSYIDDDKGYYLPIISLTTDDKNLYDNTIGIYVSGTNGKTANQDYTKRNFNMDWDRPANFEYIANGHNVGNAEGYFSQEVDIAINGGWSRKYTPRSFKVKSSKQYSLKNSLDYPFFADKPYNKNKTLLLRNGGNDEYNQTRLKDAALQSIARISEFPLNLQSYQPTHVFVNGNYLAMLNLREPSNRNFGYANYGIDTDEIDAFEMSVDSGYVQKNGTKDAFLRWKALSAKAAEADTYKLICDSLVDIDDYTNYMAFKFFLNDWDWPHNNAKGFRSRQDGKFHFMIFDLDNCVDRTGNNIFNDFQNKKTYTFYGRPEYGGTSITAEVELVTIFLNMLKNEDFKRRFIDKYCLVGGSVFGDEEEIASIVNEMADNIAPALSWEGHSPYGSGRSFAQGIINAVTGNYRQRMTSAMKSYSTFGLKNTEAQSVKLRSNVAQAKITLNDIQVPRNKFNGYLFAPITLKANTPAGYKFAGWWNDGGIIETEDIFTKASNWKYYDKGSLDGENWTAIDYNTNAWKEGQAPFGYGNSGTLMSQATTKLTKSDNYGNRIPTYYLRKEFTLTNEPMEEDKYTFQYELDDSYILYVNGEEVDIYHLWSGATYDETCQDRGNSNWYEGGDPYMQTVRIPNELLKKGKNVVAVEVHNCNATSSDIWWDASMSAEIRSDENSDYLSTDEEFELPASGSYNLIAKFTPMTDEEMAEVKSVPVHVNEVSAGNTVNINDYYKKDDWIELYNSTEKDIDIAGMYISDKAKTPLKYQIPNDIEGLNTIVPAHGHLVLWASKRDIKGEQIHTNFKLDNDEDKIGMVILTSADKTWSDTLTYNKHEGDQTYGRYPDGADKVYLMAMPTIGKTNILNIDSQFAYTYIYNGIPEPEPDPTSIKSLEGKDIIAKEYYNMNGMPMGSNREALRDGIYLVKYHTKSGKTITQKEVVK
ncbi:MAG: lamin tail domain-containing protein [Bacteroidales bacterium]|nr:lamin tail domain-containing protein [Bacteroidales bacterium]